MQPDRDGFGVQDKSFEHIRVESWEKCKEEFKGVSCLPIDSKSLMEESLMHWEKATTAYIQVVSVKHVLGYKKHTPTIEFQQSPASSFGAHSCRHHWEHSGRCLVHRESLLLPQPPSSSSFFLGVGGSSNG